MSEKEIMKIEVGEQKSQPALSIRAKILEKDLPDFVVKSFGEIKLYIKEYNVQLNGFPFLAYYNIDIKNLRGDGTWDMEVGFPVSKILQGNDAVKNTTTLNGKTISILYKGAYSGLGKAYSKLTEYIEKNEYQTLKISYEYFYNDPNDVPEEELLTRVVMLIK
jgi:effector-binding domain-containing protein